MNILQTVCDNITKMSPFFLEANLSSTHKMNDELYDRLSYLNEKGVDEFNDEKILGQLPDGAITVLKINDEELFYKMQNIKDLI